MEAETRGRSGFALLAILVAVSALPAAGEDQLRLITLDPGHFHAALSQKEMLPGVSEQVHVYAPLGPDLIAHLNRIRQYNTRSENPTRWSLEIHVAPDPLERMLRDRCGQIVVLSGNNRGKIARIDAIVRAKMHVLADKPWIIEPEDLPRLQAALDAASENGVVAYDAMTQRYDAACLLQRELVNEPAIFGQIVAGSQADPAVRMESVHYLLKEVSGVVNLRPPWFFDVRQQGEGLTDVGTHLVDLVQWTLFPEQSIDYQSDVNVLAGSHWPTMLSLAQFQRVTGEKAFPVFLNGVIRDHRLEYFANNAVSYTLRGIHIRLDVRWDFEAAPGTNDTELAIYRGSRSQVQVLQGEEQGYRSELYVVPERPEDRASILAALRRKVAALQGQWPGLAFEEQPTRLHVVIPDACRTGHEAHFALLTRQFLQFVRNPKAVPAWEKPNMLAKYFVTTRGVELARKSPPARQGKEP